MRAKMPNTTSSHVCYHTKYRTKCVAREKCRSRARCKHPDRPVCGRGENGLTRTCPRSEVIDVNVEGRLACSSSTTAAVPEQAPQQKLKPGQQRAMGRFEGGVTYFIATSMIMWLHAGLTSTLCHCRTRTCPWISTSCRILRPPHLRWTSGRAFLRSQTGKCTHAPPLCPRHKFRRFGMDSWHKALRGQKQVRAFTRKGQPGKGGGEGWGSRRCNVSKSA